MSPTPKYIYDMPYSEREKICRLLDLDGHWKILGGLMGLKTDDIHYMEHEERLGLRPTNQLLKKWGQQNHTVQELFYLLYEMKHSQAMVVLKGFVDESHHKLIYEGKSLTELVKGSNNCSGRQSSAIGNAPASAQHPDVSENFRGLNLNVMLPEPLKLNKPGFADSDKIQNIGKTVSVEANIAPSQSPESAYLHPVHAPNVVNGVLKQPHLSRAGAAAVSSAGPSNIGKDLVVTTPRRKLSDVSLSSIQNECVLPMLDYRELEIATNYWSASNILGRGGFGTVYKGVWKNTDVAIKRIELQKGESQDSQEVSYQQSLRELQALQRYHHKNILQLYGLSLKFGSQPCLIYQFMENGSLEDRLQCRNKTTPLTWSQRNNIAKGAARGLQFLHTVEKQPLIHGDIKSANILLDVNFEPRIGDFGLAREGPQTHYTHMKVSKVHGTRPYLPDEYIRSKTLSKKVDTYSFGVVLFELATGLRAYDEKRTWKYLREEVMNSKNELELMDRKAKADFTSSRSQRGDITNLSVQSIDSRILEGLLIFLRLMNAGKKCVSKLPCNRPQMEDVCQTLDQQTSAVEVTPLALQELHDKIRDFRDRCGSRSQAHSGQPLSSVPLAPSQPSPVVSINTPGQAASQINSPTDLNEQNCVARHISNISTINRPSASGLSTYHHQSPPGDPNGSAKAVNGTLSPTGVELPIMLAFGTPSIAVMPPTASDVSTISTLSSQSESSIFISHDCHPTSSALSKKVESSLEEPGPEILPLLTILGNKSFSDAEDVPEQSSSSKAPHDSMSSSSSSSS